MVVGPPPYVWNSYIPGEAVAFGVPDTDDRALRIDCRKVHGRRRLLVGGPTDHDIGGAIIVRLSSKAGARIFSGRVVEAGDGNNFSIDVTDHDEQVRELLSGSALTISIDKSSWTIPAKGAAKVLAPLLNICSRR